MTSKHRYLSSCLRKLGMRQRDLAYRMGCDPTTISHRMTGRTPWTSSEMYDVMDIIREPLENLHLVFPRGGVS